MKLIYPAEFKMNKRKLYINIAYLFGIGTGSIYKLDDFDTKVGSYEKNPNADDYKLRVHVDKIANGER